MRGFQISKKAIKDFELHSFNYEGSNAMHSDNLKAQFEPENHFFEQSPQIQPKLKVGQSKDKYEKEADRTADLVIQQQISNQPLDIRRKPHAPAVIQRFTENNSSKISTSNTLTQQLEQEQGKGRPLPAKIKGQMEHSFGSDFSNVRIHTGKEAASLNQQIGAKAFTYGSDVYFNSGMFQPYATEGKRLLAHELTHVIQQSPNIQREIGIPKPISSNDTKMIQRQETNGNSAPNPASLDPSRLFDPEVIRQAANQVIQDEETPILEWLDQNLSNHTILPGVDLIALIRRQVPEAVEMPSSLLESLIERSARIQDIALPFLRQAPSVQRLSVDLDQFTKFNFQIGGTAWEVEIPNSIKGRLPADLRSGSRIQFYLSATSSATFEFSIHINANEHIKIVAKSGYDVANHEFTSGISIIAHRKVYRAQDPNVAKRNIRDKGRALTTAINELQQVKSQAGEDPNAVRDKLISVAGAIADVYSAVEKAKAEAKPVPAFSMEFGTKTRIESGDGSDDKRGTSIGLTISIPF